MTQHETRPHNDRDREIYKEAILAWDTRRKERLCYKELSTRRSDLITHKNTTSFTNRFNVIKADERASHTILAIYGNGWTLLYSSRYKTIKIIVN